MGTQWIRPEAASQQKASDPSRQREDCARFVSGWADELISLIISDAKCEGRDQAIVKMLSEVHEMQTVLELKYLLDHVDKEVVSDFVRIFMAPDVLAEQASVNLIVRKLAKGEKPRGNIGHYVVCTPKEGSEPMMLRFGNKTSMIYYLMLLIERCQDNHPAVIDLGKNQKTFVDIYRMVYDNLQEAEVVALCERLRFREVDGHLRCGRLGATITDIRKQLSKRFDMYGESYMPYTAGVGKRISVPSSKIVFEGEATKLLEKKIA